jgi:inosine/xanthosine triphosphate pyrophosphatase family protein
MIDLYSLIFIFRNNLNLTSHNDNHILTLRTYSTQIQYKIKELKHLKNKIRKLEHLQQTFHIVHNNKI